MPPLNQNFIGTKLRFKSLWNFLCLRDDLHDTKIIGRNIVVCANQVWLYWQDGDNERGCWVYLRQVRFRLSSLPKEVSFTWKDYTGLFEEDLQTRLDSTVRELDYNLDYKIFCYEYPSLKWYYCNFIGIKMIYSIIFVGYEIWLASC